MNIIQIEISRFRSINNTLKLDVSDNNFSTFVGENNVGKTNVLRALNLFFNPELFDRIHDVPYFKWATGGAAVYPRIGIKLLNLNEGTKEIYSIFADFNPKSDEIYSGKKKVGNTAQTAIEQAEISKILDSFEILFLEGISENIKTFTHQTMKQVFNLEFTGVNFSGKRKEIKESYDKYIQLQEEHLEKLSNAIKPEFQKYNSEWVPEFRINKGLNEFLDYLDKDIYLSVNDGSEYEIDTKGSGVQRISAIILCYEVLKKLSRRNKNFVLLIDEPDAFLHEGMQKKLYKIMKDTANNGVQTFITTHSNQFIDTLKFKNVHLISQTNESRFVTRKNKNFVFKNTILINTNEQTGLDLLYKHLGMSEHNELHDRYLIVEGRTDLTYLHFMILYFDMNYPFIVSAESASKIKNELQIINNLASKSDKKPSVICLFDNDAQGRAESTRINKAKYGEIRIKIEVIKNALNEGGNTFNNTIEDLLPPEVILYLSNLLLDEEGLSKIDEVDFEEAYTNVEHRKNGVLNLLQYLNMSSNPNDFNNFDFKSQKLKALMANKFKGNEIEVSKLFKKTTKKKKIKNELVRILTIGGN
jgi:predicted ATP-dependent endonuclease of OLD family